MIILEINLVQYEMTNNGKWQIRQNRTVSSLNAYILCNIYMYQIDFKLEVL